MPHAPNLTTADHHLMDGFLGDILEDFKAGAITKAQAVGALAHVMAALDIGNTGEARSWFQNGRTFTRNGS